MYSEHQKGISAERKVLSHYEKQGWKLISQRFKTPFAEVDLLISKDQKYKLIEVKTLGNEDFLIFRLSNNQKNRLLRATEYLINKYNYEIELELVTVDSKNKIEVFSLC